MAQQHTAKLIVNCVDLALQRVGLAQRRDEELREALQRAAQRARLHVKVVVGRLLPAAKALLLSTEGMPAPAPNG